MTSQEQGKTKVPDRRTVLVRMVRRGGVDLAAEDVEGAEDVSAGVEARRLRVARWRRVADRQKAGCTYCNRKQISRNLIEGSLWEKLRRFRIGASELSLARPVFLAGALREFGPSVLAGT